jgi:hypothetical protein
MFASTSSVNATPFVKFGFPFTNTPSNGHFLDANFTILDVLTFRVEVSGNPNHVPPIDPLAPLPGADFTVNPTFHPGILPDDTLDIMFITDLADFLNLINTGDPADFTIGSRYTAQFDGGGPPPDRGSDSFDIPIGDDLDLNLDLSWTGNDPLRESTLDLSGELIPGPGLSLSDEAKVLDDLLERPNGQERA